MAKGRWIVGLCVLMTLVACAGGGGSATYDVRGTWNYVFTTPDGATQDAGTITFTGSRTRGTSERITADGITYQGDYTVDAEQIVIAGHEAWEGAFLDRDTMLGTWEGNGRTGTWTATRQAQP